MHLQVVCIFAAGCLLLSCHAKGYGDKCVTKHKLSWQLQHLFLSFAARVGNIEDYLQQPQPGPTYVRWGKTSCASTSEKLYDGRMAGAGRDSNGDGSNYLCLPSTPEYADGLNTTANPFRGEIFGAEYGGDTTGIVYPSDAHNKDIPCAVCRTISKASVLMIPAKRTCLPGWTQEYVGFLVSEAKTVGRTPKGYECMDVSPDFLNDGTNDDGAVIFPVQGRTKSLPETYADFKELSCVVCSQ